MRFSAVIFTHDDVYVCVLVYVNASALYACVCFNQVANLNPPILLSDDSKI